MFAERASHTKAWGLTLVLAVLAMVGPFTIDTYLPSFRAMALDFRVDPVLIQQTLSVYLFAFAATMLLHGTLSDTFGRRPVVLVSLLVYVAASAAAACAPTLGWLLVCRALQGMSAGAGMVVGRAIVRDRLPGHDAQRALAQVTMVFGLAPAVAPVLGGWLQAWWGWQAVFVFLALFGGLTWVMCLRFLPETLPPAARQPLHLGTIIRNYGQVLRSSVFRRLSLAVGFAFSGFALYIASAPHFLMDILHLPETAFAWLFVPMISGMVLGSMVVSRLAGRVGVLTMIRIGYAIMVLAALCSLGYSLLFTPAVPWVMAPIMLYTFGLSWVLPSITLLILDLFPTLRGMAASLQSFVQTMVFALVSGLVTPLVFGSAVKLAVASALGLTLSGLFFLLAGPLRASETARELTSK